jgi:hypothetical protein
MLDKTTVPQGNAAKILKAAGDRAVDEAFAMMVGLTNQQAMLNIVRRYSSQLDHETQDEHVARLSEGVIAYGLDPGAVTDAIGDGRNDRLDERAEAQREVRSRTNGNGKDARRGKASDPARRFKLEPFNTIKATRAAPYLVKNMIPRVGLTVVWGPPKCGKSFWAFDVVMHVAFGWSYRGRRVKQGIVVYFAVEGASGLRTRAEGWRQHYLADDPDRDVPFYLIDAPLDLFADYTALIASIREQTGTAAMVVIDTVNLGLNGSENKDEDMGAFIKGALAISREFDCAVILIHHCGVDGTRPRGHTSLGGSDVAMIAIKRDASGIVTSTVEHMRDGEAGATTASRLTPAPDLGVDEDGDPLSTCVVVPAENEAEAIATVKSIKAAAPKLSKNMRLAFDCLRELVLDNGSDISDKILGRLWCDFYVAKARARTNSDKSSDRKPDSFRRDWERQRDGLKDKGLIEISGDFVGFPKSHSDNSDNSGHFGQSTPRHYNPDIRTDIFLPEKGGNVQPVRVSDVSVSIHGEAK